MSVPASILLVYGKVSWRLLLCALYIHILSSYARALELAITRGNGTCTTSRILLPSTQGLHATFLTVPSSILQSAPGRMLPCAKRCVFCPPFSSITIQCACKSVRLLVEMRVMECTCIVLSTVGTDGLTHSKFLLTPSGAGAKCDLRPKPD